MDVPPPAGIRHTICSPAAREMPPAVRAPESAAAGLALDRHALLAVADDRSARLNTFMTRTVRILRSSSYRFMEDRRTAGSVARRANLNKTRGEEVKSHESETH